MKIALISDLHITNNLNKTNYTISSFLKDIIGNNKDLDVFIIPGDISEDNNIIIKTLKELKKLLPETKILYTYGNHELYDIKTYKYQYLSIIDYDESKKKINKLKKEIKKIKDVYFLDGEIFEYKNIKILGIPMWYDFSYGIKLGYTKEELMKLWKNFMADSKLIFWKENKNFLKFNPLSFFQDQYKKLENLLKNNEDIDIVFSHISPIIPPNMNPLFKEKPSSSFYYFDGQDLLDKFNNIKFWFFGHVHDYYEFKYNKTCLISNPYGYPSENHNELKIIEFNK